MHFIARFAHPQRTNSIKVWWWLLTFPGQREVSTGVTASAWRPASVRRPCLQHICDSQIFVCTFSRNLDLLLLLYANCCLFCECRRSFHRESV